MVAINDIMPMILWMRYFLTAQGFDVADNILHQDNMSAMKLAENRRKSSGRRARHINICYYFVTDRIASGKLSMTHCPTERMIADFYTKPLQGALFITFRDMILNIGPSPSGIPTKPINVIMKDNKSQECIGNNKKKCEPCKAKEKSLRTYDNNTMGIVSNKYPDLSKRLGALGSMYSNIL